MIKKIKKEIRINKWIWRKAKNGRLDPCLFNPDVFWGKYLAYLEIFNSFI